MRRRGRGRRSGRERDGESEREGGGEGEIERARESGIATEHLGKRWGQVKVEHEGKKASVFRLQWGGVNNENPKTREMFCREQNWLWLSRRELTGRYERTMRTYHISLGQPAGCAVFRSVCA